MRHNITPHRARVLVAIATNGPAIAGSQLAGEVQTARKTLLALVEAGWLVVGRRDDGSRTFALVPGCLPREIYDAAGWVG